MFKRKNKLSILILLIAAIGLIFCVAGGDYLHQQLHHHTDQASYDQCLWSILQIQSLVVCLLLFLLFRSQSPRDVKTFYEVFVSSFYRHLANLRAPPASF